MHRTSNIKDAAWSLAVLATACVLAPGPAHAAGTVQVKYVQPEKFADVGFIPFERERNLSILTGHFQKLATKLPDGQTLQLDVNQVDLAGRLEPTRTGQDLRVLRGTADWPQIKLHFTLTSAGSTLKEGDADLRDLNYLVNAPRNGLMPTELGYEKRMIDDWFKKTFEPAPQ